MTISENTDQIKSEAAGVKELFVQKRTPLFQNKVFLSEEDAHHSASGEVRLVQSTHTGFVFNQAFDENLMVYDVNYHNEQTNSAVYRKHQDDVYALLKKLGIDGKKVVEIGCGKGHFFNIMQRDGVDCTGFDPAYEGDNPNIVKDYFSDKYNLQADLIVLRHTLEHIGNPHQFLRSIANANNFKGHIFIEIPTFDWIVDKKAFWDIFYEHCNYFTEKTVAAMFESAQTGKLFGGQYIFCYASLESLRGTIPAQQQIEQWDISLSSKMEEWQNFVNSRNGIAIWGAGAKGSTFLNLIDPGKKNINAVIDINPAKQGKFIALTGHPIYSPANLARLDCKHIIVMNENYIEEIKQQVHSMGINANIINL